jgi:hypothetical protein
MTRDAGLWIDHRKAVIVVVSDEGEATRRVSSQVEKHVRFSGGAGSGESHRSQRGTGEDTRERRHEGQLDRYYDVVIAHLRDAHAILIFGPGEAKGELKARLERDGLGASVVAVETVDKMTDRQIAAKVRERFPR